jgi:hypothetical protein
VRRPFHAACPSGALYSFRLNELIPENVLSFFGRRQIYFLQSRAVQNLFKFISAIFFIFHQG